MARTSWWARLTGRARAERDPRDGVDIDKPVLQATISHLEDFVLTRRGVEAFVETPTQFNKPSLLLIAHDGEWTRRTIPSTRWGHQFADRMKLPAYDAGVVGYPDRMREWNRRARRDGVDGVG